MIGGEVTTPAQAAPGIAATATLYKTLRNANLAIAYQRGHAYDGYLTNKNSDRVDVTFSYNFTRRLTLAVGAGDYRELGSLPLTNGNYATAGWAYALGADLRSPPIQLSVPKFNRPRTAIWNFRYLRCRTPMDTQQYCPALLMGLGESSMIALGN